MGHSSPTTSSVLRRIRQPRWKSFVDPFQRRSSHGASQRHHQGPTERVSFDVVKNGDAFDAEVVLDRSKFDVRYGSDSFFDNLGDNVILDTSRCAFTS